MEFAKVQRQKEEAAAREAKRQERDRVRRDQLHDLGLIRRAIIAELEAQGSGSIGFHFGRGARPGDPESRALYWLKDGEFQMQAKRDAGASEGGWVWDEGMLPIEASNRRSVTEHMQQPDNVARTYRMFRFERLLVPKHLDEELRCSEPDWNES